MLLNYEEILMSGVLKNFVQSNFRNASYDLQIDQIFDMDGAENKQMSLAPQGMATIVFKETVELPDDILAFAHVKTGLARIGIMSINIGIVDPGYKGFLSTVIINYGKEPFLLMKGDSCLRLTFHQTKKNIKPIAFNYNVSKEVYLKDRQIETLKCLGDSFLNLRDVEKRIESNLQEWFLKRVGVISLSIAALALVINAANYYLNSRDKSKENTIKTLNTQTENVQERYNLLEIKLRQLEERINLKDTI